MRRWLKFARLPNADRNLLIGATLLLLAMRCGFALFRYVRLRRWLSGARGPHPGTAQESAGDTVKIDRLIWAFNNAGGVVRGNRPCLAIAMATHWILYRRGIGTDLRIGVKPDGKGRLEAHA
jgi:transglutaminase superfamily protein